MHASPHIECIDTLPGKFNFSCKMELVLLLFEFLAKRQCLLNQKRPGNTGSFFCSLCFLSVMRPGNMFSVGVCCFLNTLWSIASWSFTRFMRNLSKRDEVSSIFLGFFFSNLACLHLFISSVIFSCKRFLFGPFFNFGPVRVGFFPVRESGRTLYLSPLYLQKIQHNLIMQ